MTGVKDLKKKLGTKLAKTHEVLKTEEKKVGGALESVLDNGAKAVSNFLKSLIPHGVITGATGDDGVIPIKSLLVANFTPTVVPEPTQAPAIKNKVKSATAIEITKDMLNKVLVLDILKVPMGTYYNRNSNYEITLAKLSNERDTHVRNGETVAKEVDQLVVDAQAYAKKLTAAALRAVATSKKAKEVSALWKRIATGAQSKPEESKVESKEGPKEEPKVVGEHPETDEQPEDDEEKEADEDKEEKESDEIEDFKEANQDKLKGEADEDKEKKEDKKSDKRRLASTSYTNASLGLDLNAPVKTLEESLKKDRTSLFKLVGLIQKSHDQAKVNNEASTTLLGEEKTSMKSALAASKALSGQMKTTTKIRKDKAENFPALPKDVKNVK